MCVVSDSTQRLVDTADCLQQASVGPQQTVLTDKGVIFGTFTDMAEVDDFKKVKLVFLLNAREVTGFWAQLALLTSDARFRLFGLLQRGGRLSPREADLVVAAFGPANLDLLADGLRFRQCAVTWLPIRGILVSPEASIFKQHSQGYWRSPVRNRRVARAALALSAGSAVETSFKRRTTRYLSGIRSRRQVRSRKSAWQYPLPDFTHPADDNSRMAELAASVVKTGTMVYRQLLPLEVFYLSRLSFKRSSSTNAWSVSDRRTRSGSFRCD